MQQDFGNGMFTSGTSIGALIALSLILGIASWLNWRWAFVFTCSLGLV
jgi:predicted MFS family arabinose efflux permease